MAVRDELAAAADTVTGISCSPKYVQATETGHAFVMLDHTDYDFTGGIDHWRIYVMLPADRSEAEQFIDEHRQALYDALDGRVREHLVVTAIRPQFTQFEPGGPALPTLVVEGTREQE